MSEVSSQTQAQSYPLGRDLLFLQIIADEGIYLSASQKSLEGTWEIVAGSEVFTQHHSSDKSVLDLAHLLRLTYGRVMLP